ncbi:putative helicase MOV-10 [Armigeres subalbatus]|uniref:putative helicase MOV-10 n=1 Tax=Armigeres subalbatus TaxID=124917 RepID=UPI002ED1CBE5
MEIIPNKFMQQRFDRQKHEIESFVVRIYRHNLIKDGGIIKKKLREKLLEEIRLRRITRVKMDELGWVLVNHGLVMRSALKQQQSTEKQVGQGPTQFKFNMERLRDLLEKHEQRFHEDLLTKNQNSRSMVEEATRANDQALKEVRAMVDAKRPLADIVYVTSVERLLKHNFEPSSQNCFVCRKSFLSPEKYANHFETLHKETFKIIPTSDCFQTGQKLEVVQHYDALSPVTRFTIHNRWHMAMHIECVYLYHSTKQLVPINRDVWPITINPGDDYKFSITTGMFLVTNYDYTILVQFSRILEYIEQYHFRVLKAPVEIRVTQNPIVLSKLKDYLPPVELLKVFKNNFEVMDSYTKEENRLCDNIQEFLKAEEKVRLNSGNYVEMLQLMNNIEDYNVQLELSRYDMNDVQLKPCGPKRFYCLKLSQFTTAPKSLVEGDYIELSCTRPNKSIKTVVGVISQLCANKVMFETEEPLRHDIKWRMKFSPNRTPIRMEYQALEIVKDQGLSGFFFPTKVVEKFKPFGRNQFEWFNINLATNEEQQTAVANIVNETARPNPFVLFGPPGTGKTSTLVEAIAQIWKLKPDTRVLVTASSNFACNELTERILNIIPKEHILRFFSKHAERMMSDMPYRLIECSNLNTGTYRLPSPEELYGKRIVVSTLTSAGKLVQARIKPNHFSFVFIDECGSATEASALVPIAGIITTKSSINGTIVLSGDPKQLGPVNRSEFAANMGLRISMLERLMNFPLYQKNLTTNDYNNNVIVKLLQNYRSHKAILSFSNERFYQNELLPCALQEYVDWALQWSELPSKQFPIIFESTMGKLAREKDSTSYFNRKEIELVEFYIRKILSDGINGRSIEQKAIGVISPYKKQCIKLKQMCQRHGWNEIDVGSVEAFQGREKPIMILTTVRSGTSGIGFLSNVKRLNVALTRAKALLIVIGNPETLQQDPNWFEFIRYCFKERAIRGVKFELDEKRQQVKELVDKEAYLSVIHEKLNKIINNMSVVKL